MNFCIPNYRARSRNDTTRGHWTKYKVAKDEVIQLVRGYRPAGFVMYEKPVKVTIIARFAGRSHIDASNIDDKIYVDALRYAKLIPDDNFDWNPIVTKEVMIKTGTDQVEIVIEPIGV